MCGKSQFPLRRKNKIIMGDSGENKLVIMSSPPPNSPSLSPPRTPPSSSESEPEELQLIERAPPFWRNPRGKRLSKQLSMCETSRDTAWENRRRQILLQERRKDQHRINNNDTECLTDEDLSELKGSIELGFGFNEEQGQKLCNTLPALDLYFAVNRQFATSPVLSPNTPVSNGSSSEASTSSSSLGSIKSLGERSSSFGSPRSESDSWKILSPGDDPEQVKTRLRHWAQAVACSVMQSY